MLQKLSLTLSLTLLLTVGLLSWPLSGRAETVKAKRDGVRVFSEASSTSSVLVQLKKDQSLPARHRFGAFWSVDLPGGKIGYIRGLEVKVVDEAVTERIQQRKRTQEEAARDAPESGRARTSAAVMGVRGLADDAESEGRSDLEPDYAKVRKMEERVISSAKIEALQASLFVEIEQSSKKEQK